MASGNAKSIMEGLRADLVQGLPVEVAGYLVHAEMARGLELAQLGPPEQPQAANVAASPKTEWFDLFSNEDSGPTPVMARTQEQWKEAGFSVNTHRVKGPAFWQTTELEDAPQLIAATTRVMAPEGQP